MKKQYLLPALAFLCLPVLGHAENNLIKLSPEQIKSQSITTHPLNSFAAGGGRQFPAQVVVPPGQIEVISAPLAGAVTKVLAAYGETVKRGQPLAQLQGAQMLELQRDTIQAQAQAEVASENRRRDEALYSDGIIAGSRLSVARAAERQANALLNEKRQSMNLAGLSVSKAGNQASSRISGIAELRAPFDGVVLETNVKPGQRVETNTMLFTLGRINAGLWLEIQAMPQQAQGLAVGDAVTVVGCKHAGRLTLLAPHLNQTTQSLLLRAELPTPDNCVKPFQFVQASITPASPLASNAWRVPGNALVRHQGKVWLFVATAGGFSPVEVKVLDETEKSSLITPVAVNLPPETRVVTHGAVTLKASWLGLGAN